MVRILSLYGPDAGLRRGEYEPGVAPGGFGQASGEPGGQKADFVALLYDRGCVGDCVKRLAGGEQHRGYRGAHDVFPRGGEARVPVGAKTPGGKYRADHALMDVISTLV